MIRRWLHIKLVTVAAWLLRHYLRSPRCMRFLRKHPRLAWLPGPTGLPLVRLAVRYEDGKHLLDLNRNYAVPYLAKMDELGARFVLGLDKSPVQARQRKTIQAALEPIAKRHVRDSSYAAAEHALAGKSKIEIVHGLTDSVLHETIGKHLGTGKAERRQLDAARMVFRHLFINPFNSPDVVDGAKDGATYLLSHVRDMVETREVELGRKLDYGETVLDSFLKGYREGKPADAHLVSVDEVVTQLVGLLVAWAASVSRTVAYAVDALLDHPEAMRRGHELAVAGDKDGIWELLQEALRWQPPVPAIERLCLREGPVHRETVRRERDVSVVITAVTMDEHYTEPRRFSLDRGKQDNLTFGHGLHHCLGFDIAREQLSGIALSLLRRENLQRACKLQLVGPYPNRLDVTMEPIG